MASRAHDEAWPLTRREASGAAVRSRLSALRSWRRTTVAGISLDDWRSVLGPAMFALVAIGLLIYDRAQDHVTGALYWVTLGLIVVVFLWLVDSNRRRAMTIAQQAKGALRDDITGLGNRTKLHADVAAGLAAPDSPRVLMLLELDGLEEHMERRGYAAGDELLGQVAERLSNAVSGLRGAAYRVEGSRFAALVPAAGGKQGEIMVAATAALAEDDGPAIEAAYGSVALPEEATEADAAFQLATRRMLARKQRHRRSASRQAHAALLAVLAARRPELRDHLRDVAFRVLSVGRRLGLEEDQLDDIVRAAQLQDIGMLAVPESVLEKEGPLTVAERRLIAQHPLAGEQIVASAPGLAEVAALVRSSSERYDGTGYPDGLAAGEISLGARIIAVCVAFAAMTSPRPYRERVYDEERAVLELRREAGSQFDPAVVEALAQDIEDGS